MRERLISAAVLVPVVVIVFLLGDPWLTIGIGLIAALAAYEASRLVRLSGLDADRWLAVALAVLGVAAMWWVMTNGPISRSAIAGIAYPALVVLASAAFALRKLPSDGFKTWVGTVAVSLYAGLLAFLAGILYASNQPQAGQIEAALGTGRAWLLVLVLTVWSVDSFAYLSGKFFGRGRFMNHISPNKTWSGAIGGTLAAVVVCAVLSSVLGENPAVGALIGLLISIAGQTGDLTESMLKRAAGEKDSGHLIPGHGGILDRVDSFLFAAPVMFAALVVLGYFRPVVQLV